ncbi:MAG: hypothetical protein E7478_03915 [Ruminococcaceae bacterium]|nr:hypothetical protein [Oscillospiraceae bacterium]
MERFCDTCGSLINSVAQKCPFCGTQQDLSAVSLAKQNSAEPANDRSLYANGVSCAAGNSSVMQNYGASPFPNYGNNGYNAVNMPVQQQSSNQMTMGQWVGTILLTSCLGVISLILLLIWGFGVDAVEPRKSYCRAVFVIQLVGTIVFTILFTLLMGILMAEGSNLDWM